jgi:hypothetical protein
MGPKKRDRDTESTSKQQVKEETVTNELSAFLLAFESKFSMVQSRQDPIFSKSKK